MEMITNIDQGLRLAMRHYNEGRSDAGDTICEQVLGVAPGHPIAATLLARSEHRQSKIEAAKTHVSEALRSAPLYPPALDLKARLTLEAKEPTTIRAAFQRAILNFPANFDMMFEFATWLQTGGEEAHIHAAIKLYRAAERIRANNEALETNLAAALLKDRQDEAALQICERALERNPRNIRARAFYVSVQFNVGETAKAEEQVGWQSLTRPLAFPVPEGFADIQSFNAAFAKALREHPLRQEDWDPNLRAIRGGSFIPDILDSPDPAIRSFRESLNQAVEAYRGSLPDAPDHPHIAAIPKSVEVISWGNILESGGHQSGHVHNLGWLSGVYYVEMPPVVSEDDPQHEGWIEFNRPGYGIPASGREPLHVIAPKEGMLVVFPSYVWHRTIPFSGEGERISVAFDLYPASGI